MRVKCFECIFNVLVLKQTVLLDHMLLNHLAILLIYISYGFTRLAYEIITGWSTLIL